VPSAPNLILFLNLARAKSLPDKPSSFSFSNTKFSLSGFATIKSVAPKAVAIYPALFATFATVVPAPVAAAACAAFLPLNNFFALFNTLTTAPPGTPNSIKTLFTEPINVSGLSILFFS